MALKLPKIVTPEITEILPLSNQKITFRPFLVQEEKILLMAVEGYNQSQDPNILTDAIKNIIKNCILTPIDIDELSNLDVEWLFFKMRCKSISDRVDLELVHDVEGCGETNKVQVNLNTTKMHIPEGIDKNIKLSDTAGVVLQYPKLATSLTLAQNTKDTAIMLYGMIADCIETVYEGDNFSKGKEYPREELISWIETWTPDHFRKATDFIENLPYIQTEIKYRCEKCKQEVVTEVKGSPDFFI